MWFSFSSLSHRPGPSIWKSNNFSVSAHIEASYSKFALRTEASTDKEVVERWIHEVVNNPSIIKRGPQVRLSAWCPLYTRQLN